MDRHDPLKNGLDGGVDPLFDSTDDGTEAPLGSAGESAGAPTPEASATIYPLLVDDGNQRVLREWIEDRDSYQLAETDEPVTDADFDLCLIDKGALQRHRDDLSAVKSEAAPVLLPVLLLLPETRTKIIDVDGGAIADNVFATTIDEIVSLPIRQVELAWRIRALLRLRAQSLDLQARTNQLEVFRRAVESSGHAVYITDPDRQVKYVNPAFEKITGYDASEAIGRTPQLLHSEEMPDSYFEELWETLHAGEIWNGEIVDRRKDGDLYYAAQTIAPITDDGDVTAYVAVQNDVTERKKREETLERRTQVIEKAPVGVTISDPDQPDNPLIYINEAFEDMTGHPREEAIGRNCRFPQGERTDPDTVDRIREAVDAEEPISVDIRNYHEDGTEFWNHLTVAPVHDDDGDLVNYVGFQQDVTDRKQRERQLEVLSRVLRHNLRNELNVIQGQAETIQWRASGGTADRASAILDTGKTLMELAEKERAITELLMDKPQIERRDVGDIVRRIAEEVREEFPDASITIECPADVTASVSRRFGDAIEELLTNAAAHNDSSPQVVVTVTPEDGVVQIDICDDGHVIPAAERDVLLGTGDKSPTYHGSGLGLWLVNLIIARSDGTITHESVEPTGNVIGISIQR
jgi:PAS domain S-box-containing protein